MSHSHVRRPRLLYTGRQSCDRLCLHFSPASSLVLAALARLPPRSATLAQTRSPEARAARAYQAAVQDGPLALRAFLDQFPKGADLHVHLSGAVYAETFIRDAGEDGLCVDPAALSFAKPPCTPPLVRRPPAASRRTRISTTG